MLMITSFNETLLNQYGRRMVEEFSEKSDGSVKLVVIYEGNNVPDIHLKNIEFACFKHPGHHEFMRKFAHLHEARGLRINFLPNNQVNLTRDFRFDAVRFSFKIFSLLQALELFKPVNQFAWIDADIRCLKSFSAIDLQKFFPDDTELMSYLGRTNFPPTGAYSECGFLGFNMHHPQLMPFLNRMATIYNSGEIFTYEQWHDSWIWDKTREEFQRQNVLFKNISGAAVATEHPFINSDLGIFFDHLKGPQRKQSGHSFDSDYKVRSKT
jgi:hypothetical protein